MSAAVCAPRSAPLSSSWSASLTVRLECFVPPSTQVPTDKQIARLEADAKRALLTIIFQGHDAIFAGLDVDPYPSIDPTEATDGAALDVTWTYRLNLDDPTVATGSLV